ncbi:hypothetical protein K7X08_011920 [Anisodus acutangulus]|uniref:Uncharacterized protein n=1 Tax=Anisodus acutangulus TaxID=402998 RepID=A0A9Q1QY47_9SOLA|nr:hypothetical protein K7X08_011920 [Anisodus acutangulus]
MSLSLELCGIHVPLSSWVSPSCFIGAYWIKCLLGVYGHSHHPRTPCSCYSEYRLAGFPSWLRSHITDADSWGKIRACLADSDICPKLNNEFITADHLSPIKSGCCKPPTICGYQ